MTLAACVIETVGADDVDSAGEFSAALTFGWPASGCFDFGSSALGSTVFGSLPGVEGPLDGAPDGTSAAADFGGTSAADGGTELADAVGDALVAVEADESDGALIAGLLIAIGGQAIRNRLS